jgi:hypothetical protein
MNSDEKLPAIPPRAGVPSAAQDAEGGGFLIREMMRTREARDLIASALPGLLEEWAGRSMFRRFIAGMAVKTIAGGLKEQPPGGERSMAEVLEDPSNARRIAEMLPGAFNRAMGSAASLAQGIERLSPEDKARLASAIVGGMDLGSASRFCTSLVRSANQAHAHDPGLVIERLRPVFAQWVKNADFGEFKEAADNCSDGAGELAAMLNEEMWKYPAKMLTLMSMIPSAANAGVKALNGTLGPINNLAPDLITDVVLSLVREADAAEIGRLINGLSELVRKLHTGSVLIGDQGKPMAPKELSDFAQRVIDTLDIQLLLKARRMLAEISEQTSDTLLDAMQDHPELVKEMIAARFRSAASSARRLARTADLVEATMSDGEVADELVKGISGIDPQELAVALGRVLGIFNRAAAHAPGKLRDALSQVVNSMDPDEAGEAVGRITADLAAALKPIAPRVMPPVVKGLAELIMAGAEGGDEGMADALAALRKALAGGGVAS